jgi:hypothetical protein
MRRVFRAIGVLLGIVACLEVAYLAYANWRLPKLLASIAQPGQRVAWASAYTLYPGHLAIRDLVVEGADWSVAVPEVRARLLPTRSLNTWTGQVWLPAQSVQLKLPGGGEVKTSVEGDVALEQVSLPDGPVTLGEGNLRVEAPALSADGAHGGTVLVRLDRGGEASLAHPRLGGSLTARGLDAERLLDLLGVAGATRSALPLSATDPVDLTARLSLDGATADVEDIEAQAPQLRATGGFRWSPWDHAGAVLIDLEVARAGIAFRRGGASRIEVGADAAWLERELAGLKSVPGADGASAPAREDAWVRQGVEK